MEATIGERDRTDRPCHVQYGDRLVALLIGAFDHSEMTAKQVAGYACDKLGLTPPKGHETTAIDSYFENRLPNTVFAADSALGLGKTPTGGKATDYFS